MTLEQLIVLEAIVSQGTFRGAAERLYKSQPAISNMLKKLEDEIGITLLSRQGYRPKLTASGETFYRYATRVLRNMRELKSVAQGLNSEQEAEVLMTVAATYPLSPLLKFISDLTEEYPATHLRLSCENMGGSIERLLSEEADLVISTLDGVPTDQVEAIPLSTVTITPVAHANFKAAQSNRLKTVAEMQAYMQIVVSDSSTSSEQSRGLLPGGLRWTVSDFATKKQVILANMGWGGLPEHLIQDELDRGELIRLNVEGYAPVQAVHYLMRLQSKELGLIAQSIWERLGSQ